MVSTTVTGDLTFMWRLFTKSIITSVTIVKAGTRSALTDPHLLPT